MVNNNWQKQKKTCNVPTGDQSLTTWTHPQEKIIQTGFWHPPCSSESLSDEGVERHCILNTPGCRQEYIGSRIASNSNNTGE